MILLRHKNMLHQASSMTQQCHSATPLFYNISKTAECITMSFWIHSQIALHELYPTQITDHSTQLLRIYYILVLIVQSCLVIYFSFQVKGLLIFPSMLLISKGKKKTIFVCLYISVLVFICPGEL